MRARRHPKSDTLVAMGTRWTICVVGVAVGGAFACQGSQGREEEARLAFEGWLRALDAKDAASLWALSDDETHALFEGLASEIHDALARIERCWPEDLRHEARKAVGGDYLFRGGRGEDLFRALLDPASLRGPADPEARRVLRVLVGRREATIVTGTHDTFRFTTDREGRLRTDLLGRSFSKQPALSDLRKNLEAVRGECADPSPSAQVPSGGTR